MKNLQKNFNTRKIAQRERERERERERMFMNPSIKIDLGKVNRSISKNKTQNQQQGRLQETID